MVLFGLDISHHQGYRSQLWFNQARAEGVEYAILKATEGSGFIDSRFAENLARAEAAGMLVAAYHYQRGNVSAKAQADHIMRVVPKRVAVILDVEDNGGNVELSRQIMAILRANGWRCPLIYLPEWYWKKIGSPSLHGLPPNWKSRYPDNRQGSLASEYATVPAHYWNGFAGLPTAVLQFSSSGRVAGYAPLDLNAFRGTRAEMAALLGGNAGTPTQPPTRPTVDITEESTMELTPGTAVSKTLVAPNAAADLVISLGYVGMTVHHVKFFGPTPKTGANELANYGAQWLDPARPHVLPVPANALTAEILYTLETAPAGTPQHTAVAAFRAR